MVQLDALRFPVGQRAAVSLTYDDGLPVHHEHVAPLLEQHGVRGTFNIQIEMCGRDPFGQVTNVMADPQAWRQVAAAGHELGNHSVFHACRSDENRPLDWLNPAFNLCDYSPSRWFTEMRVANFVLQLIDGRTQRTFANTCCDNAIGRGADEQSIEPLIEKLFVAGRGEYNSRPIRPGDVNFNALGHYGGDGKTFEYLSEQVNEAIDCGGWIIFMFHGVGPRDHRLHVDTEVHRRFIEWLAGESDKVWTAPMVDVAGCLKNQVQRD
jgi:hypothetical protein